ncbi:MULTISPECIES: hypothetical protein [Lentzea]|nr:hypothetical protein [Lentzea atacamensis]
MKPGGMVALAATALAAWTGWYFATRPAGDWMTDAEAERAVRCLNHNPMLADVRWCAAEWDVVERSGERLIIRIHHDEVSAGFVSQEPAMTACYDVRHGARRVHCPAATS